MHANLSCFTLSLVEMYFLHYQIYTEREGYYVQLVFVNYFLRIKSDLSEFKGFSSGLISRFFFHSTIQLDVTTTEHLEKWLKDLFYIDFLQFTITFKFTLFNILQNNNAKMSSNFKTCLFPPRQSNSKACQNRFRE